MTESGSIFIFGKEVEVGMADPKEIFDGAGDFPTRPIGGNERAQGIDGIE